ncbi:hypothetical protein BBK82_44140 [Lentzea guizhouensis]|uniref:HTH araC/xylS-type domain-containing protein n=1 Tax=Lentzea guizhouensis TaxID=1586287 RepID=A0A1B2HVZ2_9PSEU|nr:helix-turn-helix domain-containing protein [Lentzea guizhouensis]ANZ41894.1 hypothetical protein BBK82_44140 [Lentzea guizhouensis]
MERVVEVTDLDAAREVLSAAYAKMRFDRGDEPTRLWMASRAAGAVRFDRLGGVYGLAATVEPLQVNAFGYLEAGRLRLRSEGQERFLGPGDAFRVAAPDQPYAATLDSPQVEMVILNQSVVDQVAEDVRFTGCQPVSPERAVRWRSTCAHLRDEVLPVFADEPLVVGNATHLLVSMTLATFPHVTVVDYATEQVRPHALKRAIAFIESEAARDITAADIARAARVSVRAIQLAFRRHLDTTPMAYIRRVRLAQAHVDLQRSNGTVTEIAARWGYARPSVFAAHYRTAYGVSPSQTLRSG